ncbi:low molecular weight phosphatase family protein [Hyphococcus flavus]|uniref:Low molecular weight phosphatase family protein n=1 Tax=Hyphococcus flavus TaxID=1866326 RepID=A0AAF0CBK8_9PROT|nr:low molecular weight phosphatase family protein [Hyphococcus flavus]WDI31210.1 low molecular weight phosphatase family protein [Hyphococcus flavus]
MTKSVLFACNMNSVRSPMAAALLRKQAGEAYKVDSAGVYEGGLDPFVEIVMGELGVAMHDHEPKTLDAVDLSKFDVVITLTPEAAVEARRHLPRAAIEFWDTDNPSEERGGREAIIAAYRSVRDNLAEKMRQRFA